MAKRLQYRRLLLLVLLLIAAFAGLGYRLVDLQVLRHDQLSLIAQQNTQRELFFEPRRGDILDRKGNLLATSMSVKLVCADPTLVGNRRAEVAHTLAPLLQMSENDLIQRLTPKVSKNEDGEMVTNQFVRLKPKVTVETWDQIQKIMAAISFGQDEKKLSRSDRESLKALRLKAIFAQDYPVRTYPNQTLAAHVVGFASTEEHKLDEHIINQINGKDGIELILDSK